MYGNTSYLCIGRFVPHVRGGLGVGVRVNILAKATVSVSLMGPFFAMTKGHSD